MQAYQGARYLLWPGLGRLCHGENMHCAARQASSMAKRFLSNGLTLAPVPGAIAAAGGKPPGS